MLGQQLRVVATKAEAAYNSRMLAWRVHSYGPTTELKLEEARVPPLRSPDEILVKVHATSVNPLDVGMIGGYGSRVLNTLRSLEGCEGVEFPLVTGRDFVGEVERAGLTARLKKGQHVWGVVPPHRQGAHAEYVVVKDRWAGEVPSGMPQPAAGGALYAGLTGCSAVRAAGLRPGDRALLLGLGGVGHVILQLLVNQGIQVVVGCSGDLSDRALSLGAVQVLDRHASDYDKQLEECGPYDAILDCAGLGGWEASARSWRFSRYVTLTTPLLRSADERGVPLGFANAAFTLLGQCARIVSAARSGGSKGQITSNWPHVRWAYFMPCERDIQMLKRMAEKGQFKVEVEQVYPWWEGDKMYERAAQGHARGKLILDFTATRKDD